MTSIIQTIDTPDGAFTILVDERERVLASGWTADHSSILGRLGKAHRPASIIDGEVEAAFAVLSYYGGDVAAVDEVVVRQHGTTLQRDGWNLLRRISPGDPMTYSTFAQALGRPSAVRAAASICARNAPALFVPCHRVLRSDGSLGGFAWGLEVKDSLLRREARTRTE